MADNNNNNGQNGDDDNQNNNNNNLIDMDDEDSDDEDIQIALENDTTLDGGVAVDGSSGSGAKRSSSDCDIVRAL